ncbi:amino acid ABC transporter permease/ATP-binding protein [Burkholderia pseudomallei]|uniref:amino acid ABC transporter permease/ATP-binding protein n=1 Tax=Burkholderia pseudomallei TaxID=28450 RepID=UPI00040B6916|nr:amino acid ABC transporter permease/ATP-binding protein [Burkholderia pseudomallei]AIV56955.1 amino ABC transporter, permease, 3-TM region, His/Glu/Gln/Arg/opine family domain protein [Burkholderia pseudomallei MSHR2243]AIV69833.1 amino ABC transporter, permease, 3-TM region, His/Glu/Gln/Arg/opine family domain protein [Burkholderia pseudomallei MSHR62]KGU62165.1 amino ABC transporter, permease, 3-TM region, His/Glu/Gln/Arg/opine family domain protein [Burkholderia pseudomallei MSHR465J]KGW7
MSDITHAVGGALPTSGLPAARADAPRFRIVPARHRARTAGTVLAAVLIALVLNSVLGNPQWGWPVFAEWFLSEPVLSGLARTLLLTALGALFGFALGVPLALARVSRSPLLAACAWAFIWLFRSIPLIVLLLILNNLGYLYDHVRLGVPFTGITFAEVATTDLISPFCAAVLGLTLNHAAFAAEGIRGGILSVDQGQLEAAAALGLPRARQATRIVLPQAMRAFLPVAFNDLIALAKGSSMVYVLAMPELFYTVQVIYRRNLEVIPLLMVATVWYLIILTVLSIVQAQVERRYARGAVREPERSPAAALVGRLAGALPRRRVGAAGRSDAAGAAAPGASASFAASRAPGRARSPGAARAPASGRRGGEIAVQRVSKRFGAHKVLDDVSFVAPAGSVTVILGQSGSGKSTLLRTINHLERVDGGFIDIDGELIGYRREGDTLYELKEKDVLRRRADVGMVFQNFNLFAHLTVLENIVEAPVASGRATRAEAERDARELLARVGLAAKAHAYPRQLSGGQQQRVAIARALALKPKVLLFDEPTSALDPELVNEVLDVIKELARSGTTLVIVTHEIGFAREVADTVLFMEHGRIVEAGPPAQVLGAPAHPRTRAFLSKVL